MQRHANDSARSARMRPHQLLDPPGADDVDRPPIAQVRIEAEEPRPRPHRLVEPRAGSPTRARAGRSSRRSSGSIAGAAQPARDLRAVHSEESAMAEPLRKSRLRARILVAVATAMPDQVAQRKCVAQGAPRRRGRDVVQAAPVVPQDLALSTPPTAAGRGSSAPPGVLRVRVRVVRREDQVVVPEHVHVLPRESPRRLRPTASSCGGSISTASSAARALRSARPTRSARPADRTARGPRAIALQQREAQSREALAARRPR